jgi:hypothetical protein
MARDGSGNYSLPANTLAVSGDTVSSTKFNTLVQDLEADLNVDRPIVAGGTGASSASGARTNLGLAIGTNVLAYNAKIQAIGALTFAADRGLYFTDADTPAVFTLTAAGRALIDDASVSAQRTTLGLGSLAELSSVNNGNWSGTDLAVVNGGTGASDASGARTNLGITGNLFNVTASAFVLTILDDADAAAVRTTIGAGVGDMLKSENLSGLANAGTARTNLGLGSLATLNTINNGNWSGTALAIANGGTGATSAGAALTALGALPAASYTAADVLSKLLTVDGAGSGLDADLLDGVQGSAYATLAGTQTFTGAKNFTGGLELSGVNVVSLSATQTLTNKTLTSPTINGGTIQSRPQAASETTGTLTAASANRTIQATGGITINNSVFTAGDIILIYAGDTSRTLTQGSGVTMRLGGTATTGNRTLAARGVAVLFFVSASEVVVSGGAVT